MNGSEWLPFRCSDANFTEDVVYTWQQNMPNNVAATNITTMNTMNFEFQHQVFSDESYICSAGSGNATCNQTFNTAYNSYREDTYSKNTSYMAVNNCGTRIFSHGTAAQSTTVD